jgi:hypothetical protein
MFYPDCTKDVLDAVKKIKAYTSMKLLQTGGCTGFSDFHVRVTEVYGCETWSLTLREECRLRVF